MRRRAWMGAWLAVSCAKSEVENEEGIPRSTRSREAVARVRPGLERELAALGLDWGCPAYLRIFKRERELEVWLADPAGRHQRLRVFPICGMSGDLGAKLREGDRQAPEGCYAVTAQALNPVSQYHLAMNIGYPNSVDRALGRTGNLIMIHGRCASVGCFAMADEGIEPIYALVEAALQAGQRAVPVHVHPYHPGRATPPDPPSAEATQHWPALAEISHRFEASRRIPEVAFQGGTYQLRPADFEP